MIVTMLICAVGRVWFARSIVGMSGRYWLRAIILPLLILLVLSLAISYLPHLILPAGICRIGVTTFVCEAVLAFLTWKFVLDVSERSFVRSKLVQLKEKFVR